MKKLCCNKYTKGAGLAGLLLPGVSLMVHAQDAAANPSSFTEEKLLLGLAIFLALALILAVTGLLLVTIGLGRVMAGKPLVNPSTGVETREVYEEEGSFWEQFKQKLTNAVPVDQEEKVMTDHEYDGIRELDNSLPPWWKAMFYATIVFSIIYLAAYHIFGWGQLQDEEYLAEVAQAQAQIEAYMATRGDLINENTAKLVTDEAMLAEGKSIYDANCTACHGAELQGTVGPNLADPYWLHGGSVGEVFKTIHDGVPSKGMISWKAQLSPEQIQNLASYIISMEGTNPAGAKEPQGELYTRE